MVFRVQLGRFRRMMGCVVEVTLRRVSMMSRFLMVGSVMVFCRFMMMLGGMFVVLRCLAMVLCCFLGHTVFSFSMISRPQGDWALMVKLT